MTIKLKCNGCERVIDSDKKPSIFSPLTCSECNGKFEQVDESTPVSEGNSEEEEEEEEYESEEESTGLGICPFCEREIKKVIHNGSLACCPECNKVLGVMEW